MHDGLLEYEVVDDGRELALTLLRATGYLSRSETALRPNPAGPLDPLRGPQLQEPLSLEYAVVLHRGDWQAAELYDVADEVLVPLGRVRGGGWPGRFPRQHRLATRGRRCARSAVTRAAAGRALTVRLFNASPEPSVARLAYGGEPAHGEVVDLLGEPVAPFDGQRALGAWEIATLRLTV